MEFLWNKAVRPKILLQAVTFGAGGLLVAIVVVLFIAWIIIDARVSLNETNISFIDKPIFWDRNAEKTPDWKGFAPSELEGTNQASFGCFRGQRPRP